jgi:RNA polymerase sigma-70 factor (sigma-E family)
MGLVGFGWRRQDADFVAFYEARAAAIRKTAYVLCGDWHLAEDLTQIAFTKLYQVWSRLERHEALDGYARQVLLRAFLDDRRRPWRREYATTPDSPLLDATIEDDRAADARGVLLAALAQVPKRRRAVLVLRYWEDLSIDQVADILGCSAGTVRSQASRGLTDLREALGENLHDLMPSRVRVAGGVA